MKHRILTAIACAVTAIATAQVTLPPVVPIDKGIPNVTIVGTYVPEGTFAKQFPNFMQDGRYKLNYTYPGWNSSWGNYTSEKVPAVMVPFSGKTEQFDMVISSLTTKGKTEIFDPMNGSGSIAGWNAVIKRNYRQHTAHGKWATRTAEEYGNKMQFFSNSVGDILKTHGINNIAFADVGFKDRRNLQIAPGAILLDFSTENALAVGRKKTDQFPEFIYYTLTVRNAFGDVYKTYHQLVFIDANENEVVAETLTFRVYYAFFISSFKSGAESLLNQFLNDQNTISRIKNDIDVVKQKIKTDPDYAKLVNTKLKYAALKTYLGDIANVSMSVTGSYNRYSSGISANKKPAVGYVANSSISQQANNAFEAGGNAAVSALNAAFANADAKANAELNEELNREGAEYDANMQELADDIAALPPSTGKDALIAQIQQDQTDLNGALNETLAAQNNAAKATQVSHERAITSMQQLNASIQELNKSLHPESAADSNGGSSSAGGSEPCMDDATTEWKGSKEYTTFMRTQLQADGDDAKAKMLELTIQHCKDKLSPKEISEYTRIAKETRDEARSLRNGNTFQWKN